MLEMKAVKGSTNSVSQILFGKGRIRLDNSAFTVGPHRFNRVEPGLLTGKKQTKMRTPFPVRLTIRLCSRTQVRTALLVCQRALSQIIARTDLPSFSISWQIHSRNWMVILLTGRPSTKRKSIFSSLKSWVAIHLSKMP